MEAWQTLLGIGCLLTPIVLAAMSRDRTIMGMLSEHRSNVTKQIKAETDPLHDRISRVRDEYVRRDDLDGHLRRIEKQYDDLKVEMKQGREETNKRLDVIAGMLQK